MRVSSREPRRVRRLLVELLGAPRLRFPVLRRPIDAPNAHGVYLLSSLRGRILHVGRTTTGKRGLFRRLRDHLRGRSSFAIRYALPREIDIRTQCRYQLVVVKNARQRALLEALAVGTLFPAHLGDGTRTVKGAG